MPEAAGPADDPDPYNPMVRPRIGPIPPRRDPAERDRERAEAQHRCDFCRDIPSHVLASLRTALGSPAARQEARP